MNDDDVLTLLATINYHVNIFFYFIYIKEKYIYYLYTTKKKISNEKFNEAIRYSDEVKERFGDSTKVLNMKVSCLMML